MSTESLVFDFKSAATLEHLYMIAEFRIPDDLIESDLIKMEFEKAVLFFANRVVH